MIGTNGQQNQSQGLRPSLGQSDPSRLPRRWYQPGLHRLWGELTLAAGRARDEARPAFEAARTTARERGARSFKLRAAIRLARLDGEAGERQRARDLLAPVYGWFSEGFDTPNLIEAKALLDELS